jgi:signal transduction histidine kinase
MSHARDGYAAQLARREILARLGHELRTPLNSVIGFSGVLKTNRAGNQSPRDLEMLDSIRASGERLLDLVEDLFEISSSATHDVDVVFTAVNVGAAAATAAQSRSDAAVAKGIAIDLSVETDVPVQLDADRLIRLLRKLVDNAVKFTGKGGVVISVQRLSGTDRPGAVVVQDSGIGIAPELLSSIFEPFTQTDTGDQRAHDGAGLGLHIAQQLAKSMGCHLTCESKLGVGTRFTLHLPE